MGFPTLYIYDWYWPEPLSRLQFVSRFQPLAPSHSDHSEPYYYYPNHSLSNENILHSYQNNTAHYMYPIIIVIRIEPGLACSIKQRRDLVYPEIIYVNMVSLLRRKCMSSPTALRRPTRRRKYPAQLDKLARTFRATQNWSDSIEYWSNGRANDPSLPKTTNFIVAYGWFRLRHWVLMSLYSLIWDLASQLGCGRGKSGTA